MSLEVQTLQYDSKTERAHVNIQKNSLPIVTITMGFNVPTPGDQPESTVRAAVKAEALKILEQAKAAISNA